MAVLQAESVVITQAKQRHVMWRACLTTLLPIQLQARYHLPPSV